MDGAGNLVFAASADERGGRIDLWTGDGQNVFRASSNDVGGDLNIWNRQRSSVFAAWAMWARMGKT